VFSHLQRVYLIRETKEQLSTNLFLSSMMVLLLGWEGVVRGMMWLWEERKDAREKDSSVLLAGRITLSIT